MLNALAEVPVIPGTRIAQDAFLTNNWRALQAQGEYAYTKIIKISGNVATINIGPVRLRAPIAAFRDGFYMFNDAGYLVEAPPVCEYLEHYSYNKTNEEYYPDPERFRPNFARLDATPKIPTVSSPDNPTVSVRMMVDFLDHVRSAFEKTDSRNYVFFDGNVLVSQVDPNLWLPLGCVIPVKPGQSFFRANLLRLLLIEMLRYEHIFIGMDNCDPNAVMPLVVGMDWSRCGIIRDSRY
jgi:hypothetical protein